MTNGTGNGAPKSSKTTRAGLIAGIMLLVSALIPLIDGDPATSFSSEQIGTAISAIAVAAIGLFSRDNDVSSEGGKIQ